MAQCIAKTSLWCFKNLIYKIWFTFVDISKTVYLILIDFSLFEKMKFSETLISVSREVQSNLINIANEELE